MNPIRDIYGAVFTGGSAVLMGRVVYADGSLVAPSDIAMVTYSIEQRDGCAANTSTAVLGHTEVSLASATVLSETLQTDGAWSEDATGYNFRHEIDVTTSAAFTQAGSSYLVRYVLTPVSGQPIIVRFLLEAI